MRLRCKVCQAIQPVTVADEADEDPRTQFIRRAFRAEHVASCGAGSVCFELAQPEAITVDEQAWSTYLGTLTPPPDVTIGGDGFATRRVMRSGKWHDVRVCEDCWRTMPQYVDYPFGLTSPESDGAGGAVPKLMPATVETDAPQRSRALKHVPKAVCVPCYVAAFHRVYPGAPLAELSEEVIPGEMVVVLPPPVSAEAMGRVFLSRFEGMGD